MEYNQKFNLNQQNDSVVVPESSPLVVGKEQIIQLHKISKQNKKKSEYVQVQKLQQGLGIQQLTISKNPSRHK